MIKFVALLKRRPDLDLEEFIERYENGHAPFAARHLPGFRRYERRFIRPYRNPVEGRSYVADFDVVTEIWFENRAALDAAMDNVAQPEIAAAFAEDEANLFDRAATRVFVVEQEHGTPPAVG